MKDYILGNKHIITTPELYERRFKALGYIPYEKKSKKTTNKTKKIETIQQENID